MYGYKKDVGKHPSLTPPPKADLSDANINILFGMANSAWSDLQSDRYDYDNDNGYDDDNGYDNDYDYDNDDGYGYGYDYDNDDDNGDGYDDPTKIAYSEEINCSYRQQKCFSVQKKLYNAVLYIYNAVHYVQNAVRYVQNTVRYEVFCVVLSGL